MKKLLGVLFVSTLLFSAALWARPAFVPGQIVVKSDSHSFEGYRVIKTLPKSGLTILQVDRGREFGQAMKLRAKGVLANLNYLAHATAVPLDPFYSYQWHLPIIQSNQAWDITKGEGSRVAVLDTGIVEGGSDGVNLCGSGHYDVVNQDGNPNDRSQLSHGTHVAGTISQVTSFSEQDGNSSVGTAGVAPQACVVAIKVLDDRGSGSFADIAEGIYVAVDAGVQVINMSLGVNAEAQMFNDPVVDPALQYAEDNNVLVVAAAGNDGYSSNVSYPAIYHSVVAVGATDLNNNVVDYSNRGDGLDIMAPGGDTSVDLNGDTYPDGVLQETYYRKSFGHYFLQGTSMASPHVAGVAALMFAYNFSSVDGVRNALYSTALNLGDSATYGAGLVQAYDALLSGGGTTSTQTLAAPSGLDPADGDENVSIETQFSWNSVSGADGYIVKVGTDLAEPQFEADTTSTSFTPSTVLNYGTTYTWSVQAYSSTSNPSSVSASFMTEAAPEEPAGCIPSAKNEKGPRANDGVDNDCNGIIDG